MLAAARGKRGTPVRFPAPVAPTRDADQLHELRAGGRRFRRTTVTPTGVDGGEVGTKVKMMVRIAVVPCNNDLTSRI